MESSAGSFLADLGKYEFLPFSEITIF
jgi:hypothetical protein